MSDFNVPSLNLSLMDGGLIVWDQSVVVNKPSLQYLRIKASDINIYKISLTPARLLSSCLGCSPSYLWIVGLISVCMYTKLPLWTLLLSYYILLKHIKHMCRYKLCAISMGLLYSITTVVLRGQTNCKLKTTTANRKKDNRIQMKHNRNRKKKRLEVEKNKISQNTTEVFLGRQQPDGTAVW